MKYFEKKEKWLALIGIMVLVFLLCAGCGSGDEAAADEAEREQEKTVITMMYPGKLDSFEALVESTYEDIDLQVELTTTATINGDSERRLRNGHGTDIIITTLPSGQVQEYTMDLSAQSFASSYQATVMKPLLVDGEVHYLPLPGQYSCFIINETILDQLGIDPPQTNAELLAVMDAAAAQGLGIGEDGIMFGMSCVDVGAMGTFFIGMQVPDFLGLMDGIQWLADFRQGEATFSGAWDGCLDWFEALTERGYYNPKAYAMSVTNAMPIEPRMLAGTMLACYGNMRLLNRLNQVSDEYQYTMMPFLSDEGNNPWIISSSDGYVALNKSLEKEENSQKLEACLRVLELLSTQEGQWAWLEDTAATTSYLLDYENMDQELPESVEYCEEKGYIYHIQIASDVVHCFSSYMIDALSGQMDIAQALAAVDDYCENGSEQVEYDQSVVGSVASDLLYENYNTRLVETAIGNLVADAVAEYANTEIAVVNGGGIRASLYAGDVYGADLAAVCPYSNSIVVASVTGQVIWEMLENGISLTRYDGLVPGGRFLQVSGLCYAYQANGEDEAGGQLLWVTLADGTPLELEGVYEIAINDYMAGISGYADNNGDGYTMLNLYSDDEPRREDVALVRQTDATYADAMRAYFENHNDGVITVECDGRITVVSGA